MQQSKTSSTAYLIGGAVAGAGLLYLLDPAAGARRRRALAAAAEHAYDTMHHSVGQLASGAQGITHQLADRASHLHDNAAGHAEGMTGHARALAADLKDRATEYLQQGEQAASSYRDRAGKWTGRWMNQAHDTYQNARHHADDATHAAGDYYNQAQSAAGHFHDIGSRLWHRARDLGGSLVGGWSSRVSHLRDDTSRGARDWNRWGARRAAQMSARARDAAAQAAEWAGYEERHSRTGIYGATALSCFAVGAGMMYLFDPNKGKVRRGQFLGRVTKAVKSTGCAMRATGYDLAHRLRGAANQTRSMAGSYLHGDLALDINELISRIRAEAARYTALVEQIHFHAEPDGTVTVSGILPTKQVQGLLDLLHRIPGVSHVVNRIEVKDTGSNDRHSGKQAQAVTR